ncbi:MAG TPA: hypothetical protein VNV42_07320 [Solirubrobacteraceae bacterium]|nr:hypothetical protein [Solirubrobacteraceae bacterium]
MTDTLPAGIKVTGHFSGYNRPEGEGERWECATGENGESREVLECTFGGAGEEESVAPGHYAPILEVKVSNPTQGMQEVSEARERVGSGPSVLTDDVVVSGGGATGSVAASATSPVSAQPPSFEVGQFSFEPDGPEAGLSGGAGGHPWSVTAMLGVPSVLAPEGSKKSSVETNYEPVENIKNVVVELPLGFLGDPQALGSRAEGECTQTELAADTEEGAAEKCPTGSQVGVLGVTGSALATGEFEFSEREDNGDASPVFNVIPEEGFPAEFGFSYAHQAIYMYASVVHTPEGYRLRIDVPGLPTALETISTTLTLFGEPGLLNGSGSTAAFLSNPADCSGEPLKARVELESWDDPGHPVSRETTAYPTLTGCNLLQLGASVGASLMSAPSAASEEGTAQADTPSAFTTVLSIPQTSGFSETASPPLKSATVTLPAGVSLNPAAGQGLVGCQPEGPEGINIGSDDVGPGGQDFGDPEATELGAGHAGGDDSKYDDGLYHTASGHCPAASTVGTVEAVTPDLAEPLRGHMYVATPKCGGAGQPACTEASATNGELFGVYLEIAGSGVIVKLPGSLSADPQTGQLTVSFKENPQFPVSELKLQVHGGPRAPLANPQTCGQVSTNSVLEPWGAPQARSVTSTSAFTVTGCGATMPFAPSFAAGTTNPAASAYSPFTLTLSRQDGEQDLTGLEETMPPGLLAKLAGVALCGEAQANSGTCGPENQIGTVTVLAGAGSEPLVETGRIYLTGHYNNGPFGISVVVPAVAGPFNLGNVVVRGSIRINPSTAQATVVSNPFPTIVDGVSLRVKTINVTLTREGFTFNPTNCAQQHVTAKVSAEQGATANVSYPFQATGCTGLPFKPSLTASTQGQTSRPDGASLTVKVAQSAGEANIHAVDLQLPVALPARLSTLSKACTEAQFVADPAGCPASSVIGTAIARTPLLNSPLSGPAYIVSHGGAAYPDVEFVLQGEEVEIVLDGGTSIKKGILYSSFETVPDAPIASFETVLPEGSHSGLTANGKNLCKATTTKTVRVRERITIRIHGHPKHTTRYVKRTIKTPRPLTMPTTITAQNGATIKQNTTITPTGCPTHKKTTGKHTTKNTPPHKKHHHTRHISAKHK